MTNEEAIKMLKSKKDGHTDTSYEWAETVRMAIKALEQQTCDDAISRDAVDKYIARLLSGYLYDEERERLEIFSAYLWELPSVTQKSGKWIDYRDEGFVECPFCGHATNCEDDIDELHYCFYCGCRMVEPQESEE